jgi:hypothetical protein
LWGLKRSAIGKGVNFSTPQTFTVTAADTTTENYTVTVIAAASDTKAITAFSIVSPVLSTGTEIDEAAKTINVTLPYGTDPATDFVSMTASLTHTGVSVNPASGTAVNFTSLPVTYTVTAADTTTQAYQVTVAVGLNTNAGLDDLWTNPPGMTPAFGANVTSYDVTVGTTVTSITITAKKTDPFTSITIGGASPVEGPPNEYSHTVNLNEGDNTIPVVVTAEDGTTTKTYTLTVHRAYAIGSTGPGSGKVFYDKGSYSNGWRYLEVSPTNLNGDTTIEWIPSGEYYETNMIAGAVDDTVGSGKDNTNAIAAALGNSIICPALICKNYSGGGFSDWFLPSKDELLALASVYTSLSVPFNTAMNDWYWSSTEGIAMSGGAHEAIRVKLDTTTAQQAYKVTLCFVRAIRRF